MWERFRDLQGGVLIVGHGTRVAEGVAQLIELSGHLQALVPEIPAEPGFLELAEPTIPIAMEKLRSRGARRILVVPILLFEAAHARTDIPEAAQRAAGSMGLEIVAQSPPLGTAQAALDLSEFRYRQALQCRNPAGCLIAGACHQVVDCFQSKPTTSATSQEKEWSGEFGSIGFAMVGRGTSDSVALDQMRYFTELRVASARTPTYWVQTGFFAGGKPDVDQLLIQAAVAECDTLVIQPHLLFEGELVRQLREKVAITQRKTARSRWLVTPTLGADPHLAEAFFKLATETLRMTMPSNSSSTHVATDGVNS